MGCHGIVGWHSNYYQHVEKSEENKMTAKEILCRVFRDMDGNIFAKLVFHRLTEADMADIIEYVRGMKDDDKLVQG